MTHSVPTRRSSDLVEPADLFGRDVPRLAGRRLHRRAVVAGAGAGGVRRRQRARGAALRPGRAHTRRRTGPGRGDLAARGWRGRAIAQAHPEAVGRGYAPDAWQSDARPEERRVGKGWVRTG